ncbi:MAG: division/cell wall cluster transcriptional repressor MraZ [Gemmatimonadetes bacterium]|nr:division/cell wall cluster transcriptional repressor MraZ [Gemmatimonadota bacterium]
MAGSRSPLRGGKFLGRYLHQLDEKGRLSLPAPYRRESADQRFILVQPYPPALALYPEVEWVGVEERLQDMMRDPQGRLWVLRVLANATEVVPDAQGRILIPQTLREAARLDNQALLVGAINKVELWNPELFEAETQVDATKFEGQVTNIFR